MGKSNKIIKKTDIDVLKKDDVYNLNDSFNNKENIENDTMVLRLINEYNKKKNNEYKNY